MTPIFIQGALLTLAIWLASAAVSLIVGVACGILRCRQLRIAGLSVLLDAVTFILRGVPYYVQLLIAYFVLPNLIGINIPTFIIASGSLGLCSAAYVSQIVRGGLNALPVGQWEAAHVLGITAVQTVWYIILPQLVRAVLPSLIGEFDQLLKSTSILSAIGVLELTRAGMNVIAREMNPIPVYLGLAVCYLMFSAVLNGGLWLAERRLNACRN